MASKNYKGPWARHNMTLAERLDLHSMPCPPSACILWLGAVNNDGYGKLRWGGKLIKTHRLAWASHRGEIPIGLHVLHKCDVRSCVNPAHLFLGTHRDNVADMDRKGRRNGPRGAAHGRARLSESAITAIRLDSRPHEDIAADYDVARTTISAVKARDTWRHLK